MKIKEGHLKCQEVVQIYNDLHPESGRFVGY